MFLEVRVRHDLPDDAVVISTERETLILLSARLGGQARTWLIEQLRPLTLTEPDGGYRPLVLRIPSGQTVRMLATPVTH